MAWPERLVPAARKVSARRWARTTDSGASKLNLYVIDYGLNYFANPSGYINGLPGDQHEQADERTLWGGQLKHSWFLGPQWKDTELSLGAQLRQDRIASVGLYATENRQRTQTIREDRIRQTALAFLLEARTQWTGWLRSTLGLRRDQIDARVTPLAGQFINLIKDSSLVSVISITDLTKAGREVVSSTFSPFEVWFTVALLYLVLTGTLSFLVRRLEVKYAKSN